MNDERATESPREPAIPGARPPAGEDDPFGAALRALPAERAGSGFTGRVMARLDERDGARRGVLDRPGSFGRRFAFPGHAVWAALATAALAVVLGLVLVRGWSPPPPDQAIASADPTPAEAPAATAPRELEPRISGGSEGATAAPPVALSEPAGAAGSSGEEALRPPSAPSREPVAPGGATNAGLERQRVTPARTESIRPAAGPEPVSSRRRATDRGATEIPAADARSALERMRAELDALRRDHRRFEVALAELPEIGRDGQPVVFLGGDEGLGLVLDLGREAAASGDPEAGERGPSL